MTSFSASGRGRFIRVLHEYESSYSAVLGERDMQFAVLNGTAMIPLYFYTKYLSEKWSG